MSADDMLAAQLWPWPDPIIKRDVQGGVIFVNAAFLQIYGGQVTDWHGCAVDGWPAPQPGYAPNRFETRMPSVSGEIIYDWLEYVMPDGGALAISRNVTALLTQTPPTDPALAPIPHLDPAHSVEQAPAANQNPADIYTPTDTHMTAQAPDDVLPVHVPVSEDYTEPAATPEFDTAMAPEADIEAEPDYITPLPEPSAEAPAAPLEAERVSELTPVEPEVEAERDHVRRALPIENEASLLGDNWRDAVIAKAVGPDAVQVETQAPAEPAASEIDDASAIAAPASELLINANDKAGATRVLLAEDNAINALLTRTLLEADGCFVDVVEDGSLAVEAMRTNKYDMILMDMRMPNMDGLEATRKIRALSNEAKAIPIVALTANAFDDDRNACFDAGMNDFMTKPVSAEELQQMVQTWTKSAATQAA